MPPPEERKLENIPDMTLPERDSNPAKPAPPPVPMAKRLDKRPPWEKPAPPQQGWKVGDRVLAPWEPMYLYVGTIKEIKVGKALIQFDDGDAGWVFLDQLDPVVIKPGQKVLSRRDMGPLFYPGEIDEVRGDEVLIDFDDGTKSPWTRIAALRIPCDDDGPGAEPTKVASNQAFIDSLQTGARVWAPWNVEALYSGTVAEIREGEARIRFDDGDQGWVQLDQLLPFDVQVGLRVLSRWQMGAQYFPGVITKVEGERIHIRYDDGDQEWTRPAALMLPRMPAGPGARPIKGSGASGSSAGPNRLLWLVPIGIILFLALVWAASR